ncbi:hypothetical protein ACTG9Q_20150 [Actinokineospora sp. 24-640]
MADTQPLREAATTWATATSDATALGPAAEAHERMRRAWADELAAYAELAER